MAGDGLAQAVEQLLHPGLTVLDDGQPRHDLFEAAVNIAPEFGAVALQVGLDAVEGFGEALLESVLLVQQQGEQREDDGRREPDGDDGGEFGVMTVSPLVWAS